MYDFYPTSYGDQAAYNGGLGYATDYGVEQSHRPLSAQVAERAAEEQQNNDAGAVAVAASVELQA